MYTSLNWAIMDSGNDLSPVRYQAIAWTNDDMLLIGSSLRFTSEIFLNILSFSCENVFEGVCKMSGISFSPEYDKQLVKNRRLGRGPQGIALLCTE